MTLLTALAVLIGIFIGIVLTGALAGWLISSLYDGSLDSEEIKK